MSLLDTKRIIRSGFINFWRNGIVSVASLLVVTITLCVITGIFLTQAVLQNSLNDIKNKVDVTVYLTTDAAEADVLSLKSDIEKLPEVSEVSYVSKDQALADFKTRHQDDYLTLQALDELDQNPLGAMLNIRAKDPSQYEDISAYLDNKSALSASGTSIIDSVNYHQNKVVIDRLGSIIAGARRLGFLITLVLVLVSVIITFNTIRLTIYFAREEIGIMRLVGAENKYIRGPFMIEGIIYGVVAAVLTTLIFMGASFWLGKNMESFLGMNVFNYYISNLLEILAINVVAGVFLGTLSSFLATRKYLRK